MGNTECALDLFNNNACSQAMLMTYGPALGLSETLAHDVAKAFEGGMAFTGATCGAVTAAFMILGLKYDTTDAISYANYFIETFSEKFGSIQCKDILGCDISTTEGIKFMMANNLKETRCVKCLEVACQILDPIISKTVSA